jgi:hypothetical protein
VKSVAPAEFWRHYEKLPLRAQKLADRYFAFFERDPLYPSLHLERIRDEIWSVRIGGHYRALAKRREDCWLWFWIGTHEQYNKVMRRV